MAIELNHAIIPVADKRASAGFPAGILGLEAGPAADFVPIGRTNGVTRDLAKTADFHPQDFAFRVSDEKFDAAPRELESMQAPFYAALWRGAGALDEICSVRSGGSHL